MGAATTHPRGAPDPEQDDGNLVAAARAGDAQAFRSLYERYAPAVLGFLSGSTGIGGGIFLSPVVIALGWGTVREAASVASAFIVLNSIAGLAAKLPVTPLEPSVLGPLIVVVIAGALLGSYVGAQRLSLRYVQMSLGLVLLVAALKNLTSA